MYLDKVNASALTCRQYPQKNQAYEKVIRAIAARILSEEMQLPYKWKFREANNSLYFEAKKHPHMYQGDSMSTRLILTGGSRPNLTIGAAIHCFGCGKELHDRGNGFFCDSCRIVPVKCRRCGEVIGYTNDLKDYPYIDRDGAYYCARCWTEFFKQCTICKTYHHKNAVVTLGEQVLCEACADKHGTHCSLCGKFTAKTDVTRIAHYDYEVCPSCLGEHFVTCPDCGQLVEDDDVWEDSGTLLCEACYDARHERERRLAR